MKAKGRRMISQIYRPSLDSSICKSCLLALNRSYASASAATHSSPSEQTISQQTPPVVPATSQSLAYNIKAGVVLSRPPLLTRDLHPFEKAFYLYQRRLNERLALPFTRYFYYQKDTPADIDWKRKVKERLTAARDIGVYHAYGKEGWNDELLVGARESEPEAQVEALLKDAEVNTEEEGPVKKEKAEKPMPRITEADTRGDFRSLNRLLARTLYLVVKGEAGGWVFPCGELIGKESLQRVCIPTAAGVTHAGKLTIEQAAERLLVQAAGVNMNTWIVGHAPVGHHNTEIAQLLAGKEQQADLLGEKTFFMKARIMAGQANLKDNKLGLADFRWLAKEEVQKDVHPQYWKSVKNMLVER
ncbi:54S ribosomal protein L17 mitochondrial [Lambiella insularis]|nr:54S ribosomal protein L17 mitochondrial [Lambiella insularis]